MKPRHELKYLVSPTESAVLEARLRVAMQPDVNSLDGQYMVRSMYFDDLYRKAISEKLAGVDHRFKYRLRMYNGCDRYLRLERKERVSGASLKSGITLTREQAEQLLSGRLSVLLSHPDDLSKRFFAEMSSGLLRPSSIVEYHRVAFTHPLERVRITIDRSLRSNHGSADFFSPQADLFLVPNAPDILEIKYDRYIPSHLARLVRLGSQNAVSNSKYVNCAYFDSYA